MFTWRPIRTDAFGTDLDRVTAEGQQGEPDFVATAGTSVMMLSGAPLLLPAADKMTWCNADGREIINEAKYLIRLSESADQTGCVSITVATFSSLI